MCACVDICDYEDVDDFACIDDGDSDQVNVDDVACNKILMVFCVGDLFNNLQNCV